ncbi:uncharacterized protein LOC132557013 [Ylistrum balloti]|uniref:uncharacterized protein LOC132557013 n=1 Tax=Ylistrum balloti TaxID=509963 RepID=UPI002905B0AF|nr:uncharacterized protein LOC132557013 [Ylistrum balloti]
MFTLRTAPHHYPECYWDRRPSTCRQAFNPGHLSRRSSYKDNRPLPELTDILLPLLSALTGHTSHNKLRQPENPRTKKWVQKLNLRGYDADDVTITTKEGRALIKARRVDGDENCSDVYESNRVISIPEGVDISSMKSRFTHDGLLTIEANVMPVNENKAFREVPVEIGAEKPKSEVTLEGQVSTTGEKDDFVKSEKMEEVRVIDGSIGDINGETGPEGIVDNPESIDSLIDGEDFEIVESKRKDRVCDEVADESNILIQHEQSLMKNEEYSDLSSDQGQETRDDDLDVCEESRKIVRDEKQKTFTLSFNKDQFGGDGVQVLHKGNSIMVKSQKKECEDGVSRSEYYSTQYTLPDNVDVSKLSCSKRSDGQLLVTAPYKENEL